MAVTNFLDLDAIAEQEQFSFKLNGKVHMLKVATVATFAENMKEIQSASLDASLDEEVTLIVKIVKRAFPTMVDEEIQNLTLPQLKRIANFALQANSQVGETETRDAAGN